MQFHLQFSNERFRTKQLTTVLQHRCVMPQNARSAWALSQHVPHLIMQRFGLWRLCRTANSCDDKEFLVMQNTCEYCTVKFTIWYIALALLVVILAAIPCMRTKSGMPKCVSVLVCLHKAWAIHPIQMRYACICGVYISIFKFSKLKYGMQECLYTLYTSQCWKECVRYQNRLTFLICIYQAWRIWVL